MINVTLVDDNSDLFYQLAELDSNTKFVINFIDESIHKDKACKFKYKYAAKMIPFVLIDNDKRPLKAFYSEDKSCTLDNIKNYLNESKF